MEVKTLNDEKLFEGEYFAPEAEEEFRNGLEEGEVTDDVEQ